MWQNKITSTSWWSSFFYSLVRLIIPPVFSTASRLTNSYHFSGNVAWQFFYDFSSASRLRTFYDFSGASRLKITCTFSCAPRLRNLLIFMRFAPDKALRAWGRHGQVWTHFSHLDLKPTRNLCGQLFYIYIYIFMYICV